MEQKPERAPTTENIKVDSAENSLIESQKASLKAQIEEKEKENKSLHEAYQASLDALDKLAEDRDYVMKFPIESAKVQREAYDLYVHDRELQDLKNNLRDLEEI